MRLPARSLVLLVVLVAAVVVALTHSSTGRGATAATSTQTTPTIGRPAAASSTVAPTSCPMASPWSDGGTAKPPASARPGSALALVPGTPAKALICRYNGFNEPGMWAAGFGLSGQRALGATAATGLARQFDKLPKAPSGAMSCPMDEGASATVYFSYASGADARISVALQGCARSDNGLIDRMGYPALLDRVSGSHAFIAAHEATVSGTVAGAANLKHLSVALDSNGDWTSQPGVHAGHFSGQTIPGLVTVKLVHNQLSLHPQTLAQTTVTANAGTTAHVTLTAH